MNKTLDDIRIVNFKPLHPIEIFSEVSKAKDYYGLYSEYFQLKEGISIELVKYKNKYYVVEKK
jgi:hypothetical protein